MSAPRFFLPHLPAAGTVALTELEARHASTVLRLQTGAEVVLFDGQGGEALGRIGASTRREVQVEISARCDTNRELPQLLELYVALPKGDRQKTLIDGLVQLGTTRLTPLICQRGVAQPTDSAVERLQRSVLESSKQCGRNQLMEIRQPQTIDDLLQPLPASWSLVAHPYGGSLKLCQIEADRAAGRNEHSARVAIGPEGGFTDSELSQLTDSGWKVIGLGPRILRIETAALQIAAWWASRF